MSLYDTKMREQKEQRREMKSELTTSLTTTLTASLQSSLTESLRPSIEAEVQKDVAKKVAAIVTAQTQTCVAGLEQVCKDWESALGHEDIRNLSAMVPTVKEFRNEMSNMRTRATMLVNDFKVNSEQVLEQVRAMANTATNIDDVGSTKTTTPANFGTKRAHKGSERDTPFKIAKRKQ